ncbi:MAG: hypothetical protein ACK5M0_08160 [Bacteroidales bacterium]
MKDKSLLRIGVIMISILISFNSFSQDKILSKKIVYEVKIMNSRIEQSEKKDSIVYDYLVDKRFWWQTIDTIISQVKSKKLYFKTSERENLVFDSIKKDLQKKYLACFKDTLTDKKFQKLLEEEIRAIKFEEEWTYNPQTMLINKKVIGYNPIITRDSVVLQDEDLVPKESFRFELGWIYPSLKPELKDTLCVVRNIHFTIPIYNKTPYHWWDSHIEPEYSLPYFESYMQKAEQGQIKVYAQPNSTESYTRAEIIKRKQFEMMTTIDTQDIYGNDVPKDTIIKGNYNTDNLDYLRFGDEWYFDIPSSQFVKNVNYLSPMIQIIGMDGGLRGLMPIYYLRRR